MTKQPFGIFFIRGRVVRDFLALVYFSWIYSLWSPDFEVKTVLVFFVFAKIFEKVRAN
jgi:hypothetical protein